MLTRAAWLGFAAAFAVAPTQASLSPYDAQYDLSLVTASGTDGPRAMDGVLEYRVARACAGWETRSRVIVNAVFRGDTISANERIFTSWESDDGTQYRFAVQTSKNGVMVESIKGAAKLGKGGGEVTYEATVKNGQKVKVPLPRDTFLPLSYVRALLNHAAQGDVLFSGVVLNGSFTGGPRVLSTAIGPREPNHSAPGVAPDTLDPQLLGSGWPVSFAFFNLFENKDAPLYEMVTRQHESGVVEDMQQSFSDFSIAAHLTHLKRLRPPSCARG